MHLIFHKGNESWREKDTLQSLAKNLRSQALTCLLLPAALSPALSPGASQQHMPALTPGLRAFTLARAAWAFPVWSPNPMFPRKVFL